MYGRSLCGCCGSAAEVVLKRCDGDAELFFMQEKIQKAIIPAQP
jgi:hypothetical protein